METRFSKRLSVGSAFWPFAMKMRLLLRNVSQTARSIAGRWFSLPAPSSCGFFFTLLGQALADFRRAVPRFRSFRGRRIFLMPSVNNRFSSCFLGVAAAGQDIANFGTAIA
ncbi:MAG: hypothetical protein ABIP48_08205 [Planctomycetota bacterium]